MKTLVDMQAEVTEQNERLGWYDAERTVGDGVALLHTEVSELYEAFRQWGTADMTHTGVGRTKALPDASGSMVPKPEGVGSEAADILIRLLDECDRQGIDLTAEYDRKMRYNALREYRHGGKRV